MSNETFNVYLYLNIRPNRKPWSFIQWLEPCKNLINVSWGEWLAWHTSCPEVLEGVQVPPGKNRCGCSDSVARLKGTCKGSFVWPAAFSDSLDNASVSFNRSVGQIADSLSSHVKALIVEPEKRMGTFFRRWPFKCRFFPPRAPVSLLFRFHTKCVRNLEPFPWCLLCRRLCGDCVALLQGAPCIEMKLSLPGGAA